MRSDNSFALTVAELRSLWVIHYPQNTKHDGDETACVTIDLFPLTKNRSLVLQLVNALLLVGMGKQSKLHRQHEHRRRDETTATGISVCSGPFDVLTTEFDRRRANRED